MLICISCGKTIANTSSSYVHYGVCAGCNVNKLTDEQKQSIRESSNHPAPIQSGNHSPGSISNAIIRARNGGVKHQFEDNIGGCSANYR